MQPHLLQESVEKEIIKNVQLNQSFIIQNKLFRFYVKKKTLQKPSQSFFRYDFRK